MATAETKRASAAAEAWALLFEFFLGLDPYLQAIAGEFGLTEAQGHALVLLEPGRPLPMHELADALHCHASNVTGLVDALERRGLVERRPAEHDRRVKMIAVTGEGAALRKQALRRLYEPPAAIAALSAADQRALRDVMRRVLAAAEPA
ncbi:MAG: MarR family transcriptional regulator [Thermoleophilia bacterium]|nr:MarR family transcriptional regulator [Thermoleophilia bacterium]